MAENRYAAASASQQNVVEFRGKNDHARPAFNAWRWLNQVASDETLTHANLRVAHALANFFNISKSGLSLAEAREFSAMHAAHAPLRHRRYRRDRGERPFASRKRGRITRKIELSRYLI